MAMTNIAVHGSYRYWQLLMLPYLANCCNWQLRMLLILPFMEVAVTGNYLCCYIWQIAVNGNYYVAIYGSYRYWQLLMLPYLADCRKWRLLMLPFLEVTISGNYLCARSGNIGYYHSNMCIKCNNVMYMYNK